jgi:hypothetical protein
MNSPSAAISGALPDTMLAFSHQPTAPRSSPARVSGIETPGCDRDRSRLSWRAVYVIGRGVGSGPVTTSPPPGKRSDTECTRFAAALHATVVVAGDFGGTTTRMRSPSRVMAKHLKSFIHDARPAAALTIGIRSE